MTLARLLAWTGMAGLLAFLPFGIAGQQISLSVGALGVLLDRDARREIVRFLRAPGRGRPLLAGVVAWIFASLIALLLSGHAAEGARELRKLLLLPALVLPLGAIRSRRDLRSQTAVLLLAVSAAAILGLVEQARGAGHHPARLDGPIGFYMTTAGVFLLLTAAALGLAAERECRLAAAPFLLASAALVLTYTRGAWFGLLAAVSVLLLRRSPRLVLPALLLLLAIFVSVPALRDRFVTSWDPGFALNRERIYLWDAGRRAFLDHPGHGMGLQNLRGAIDAYRSPEARETITHFHSLYIQTAVAMGVPGLLALGVFFAGLLSVLVRAAREAAPGLPRGLAEGAIASLAAFLVQGFFEWNLGDSEVALTLYTLVGLSVAAGVRSSGERSGR